MKVLTPQQRWAVESDRHTVVTASAGSGKTTVLVQRYLRLVVEHEVDPQRIVAITFTRKAAAEMYARIAAELERLLAAAQQPQELRKFMFLRERLTGAPISTIHSFCAQLLRRFPLEVGVLPSFAELNELEALRLRREVALQTLEELWSDPKWSRPLWELLRQFGRSELEELLQAAVEQSERLVLLQPVLERPWLERLRALRTEFAQALGEMLRQSLPELTHAVRGAEPSGKQARERLVEAEQLIARLHALLQQPEPLDISAVLEQWRRLRELLFSQDGEPRVSLRMPQLPVTARLLRFLDEFADAWQQGSERDPELLQTMDLLARLAQEVLARLEAEKYERNVLDFNDLQLKALQLLQREEVLERLRREIQFLLVDEFQDTNPVQYALVQRLLALERAEHWIGPHVFIVGDPKQSIYGFRDADVRVFERARQELCCRNEWATRAGKLPERAELERRRGDIHLPVSFRLLPELVGFVNTVAGRLFASEPAQVAYEPLVCGRSARGGSIRFLLARRRRRGQEESVLETLSEEELIARAILQWVEGESPLQVWEFDPERRIEQPRPVRWGDIAILTRYRRHLPDLVAVLQQYEIPYLVHAGAGFFQAPEIQDLYSLLRVLHNVRDELALAAVLCSPLFGISSEQLFRIRCMPGTGLWEQLCAAAEQMGELRWVVELLQELLLLAPRVPVAELLQTVNERTAWYLRLRNSPRSAQVRANLDKLLELAREFTARGFRTLPDFVQELGELISMEARESEATLPTGLDAVNVLTIHAAKGLEFPVVVLYRTAEERSRLPELFFSESAGLLAPPMRWERGARLPENTPAIALARYREFQQRYAEEQRVLYVALTRARDHLAIAGTLMVSSSGITAGGLLEMLLQGMQRTPEELTLSRELLLETTVEHFELHEQRSWQEQYQLRIPCLEELPLTPKRRREEAPAVPVIALPEPVRVRWAEERLSATQYALYRHAPEVFVRRSVLGIPASAEELLAGAVVPRDSEREPTDALVAGTLFHELMAQFNRWVDPDGDVEREVLERLVNALIGRSPYARAQYWREWLQERALAVAQTPFVRAHRAALRTALFEYALSFPLGENFLTGTLDLLVPTDSGQWEVWDWKTDRIASPQELERRAELYTPQMQVYAFLVLKRYPQQPDVWVRLLFVEGSREGVPEEHWVQSRRWSRTEIEQLESELTAVAARLFFLPPEG